MAFFPRNPNPFGFPGGAIPGFNASHFAANGISNRHGFSGISSGANFLSLIGSKLGTVSGTAPTAALDVNIGPCTALVDNATTKIQFGSQATINDSVATFACILTPTLLSAFGEIFTTSSNATGFQFSYYPNGTGISVQNLSSFTQIASNLTLTVGVPYFLAVSTITGSTSFVVKNMQTGIVKTATSSTAYTSSASNGTYNIGSNPSAANCNGVNIATMLFSPTYLSMQSLLKFSEQPWEFWYPRKLVDLVGVAAGATRGLFYNSPLTGLGSGGSFFPDRLAS